MSSNVFLALGSNLGDRESNLREAVKYISLIKSTEVLQISGVYETEPVGYTDQHNFLNMVIRIETALKPDELLNETQKTELGLKRTRGIRWGPRTIDIDILLYDNERIVLPELVIPHPRMFERAFVLVPLRDVYFDECIYGRSMDELINKCSDKDGIRYYGQINRD
jgi:2-amino-4-hydroxy-6-hydroxymethyldihydropteridine diphosphokinase